MKLRKVAVDECISPRLCEAMQAVYRHIGYDFVHVEKLGGGADEHWADVFKRFGGEIVLSGDVCIAKKPHQQAAFIDAGLICFFPKHPFQHLKSFEKSAYLIHCWHYIHRHLDEEKQPACWGMDTMHRGDVLSLKEITFKRMAVPEAVLEETRKAKDR